MKLAIIHNYCNAQKNRLAGRSLLISGYNKHVVKPNLTVALKSQISSYYQNQRGAKAVIRQLDPGSEILQIPLLNLQISRYIRGEIRLFDAVYL